MEKEQKLMKTITAKQLAKKKFPNPTMPVWVSVDGLAEFAGELGWKIMKVKNADTRQDILNKIELLKDSVGWLCVLENFAQRIANMQTGCAPSVEYMDSIIKEAKKTLKPSK